MRPVDCHAHTVHFSTDAAQTVEELLADARDHNLAGICLTDHYDKDVNYTGVEHIFDVPEYFARLGSVQSQLKPQDPQLYIGIELGYMPHLTALYNQMLADWPFDSVIISLHNMDGTKDIFVDRSVYDQGVMPAYSRALSQMAAMLLACPGARILGHFDYISRYVPGTPVRMDYAPLAEEFDALFATLIESGRALELNTRTVLKFQQLGLSGEQAWPDPAIFRRYADMGGAYVTLGSDTHQIGQAATLFPEALAYLRWVGIRQITHFVQGKPVVTSLY